MNDARRKRGAVILAEAIQRLVHPLPVAGTAVLAVALAGIAVNVTATWVLSQAGRESLNVEGAFQHILTDAAGFIATALAAVVIITTGFRRADAIASSSRSRRGGARMPQRSPAG